MLTLPLSEAMSWMDGYQCYSTSDIDHIASNSTSTTPMLVVLALDRDNAFVPCMLYLTCPQWSFSTEQILMGRILLILLKTLLMRFTSQVIGVYSNTDVVVMRFPACCEGCVHNNADTTQIRDWTGMNMTARTWQQLTVDCMTTNAQLFIPIQGMPNRCKH